ncbi:MAG: hypothetical protein V1692_03030, partial [bacterium]
MKKIIINILIVIILVIFQVGLIPALPYPLNNFPLVLGWLIFLAVILDFKSALGQVLGIGFLLEIFSVYPYGLLMASLFLIIVLIRWLFNQFFTNRSYYSLLFLGFIGIIFYQLLILSGSWLFYALNFSVVNNGFNLQYLYGLLWQVVLNLVWLTIIWLI